MVLALTDGSHLRDAFRVDHELVFGDSVWAGKSVRTATSRFVMVACDADNWPFIESLMGHSHSEML